MLELVKVPARVKVHQLFFFCLFRFWRCEMKQQKSQCCTIAMTHDMETQSPGKFKRMLVNFKVTVFQQHKVWFSSKTFIQDLAQTFNSLTIHLWDNFHDQYRTPFLVHVISHPHMHQCCTCKSGFRSQRCGYLVTWFCYQFIAKPGNKTAAPLWPDPYSYTKSFPW